MAQYSADIRVGITGKTQLNALEKQLDRINKDLVKINKGLKAQTLTINTKGANRALDQLDRKINKLNRTIKVNASISEKRTSSGSGSQQGVAGGSGLLAAAAAPAIAAQIKKNEQAAKKAYNDKVQQLRDEGKGVDKVVKAYADLQDTAAAYQQAQTKASAKQEKISDLTNKMNAANREAARIQGMLDKGRIKDPAKIKANTQELARQKVLARDYASQIGNANKGQGNLNNLLTQQNSLQQKALDLEKQYESQLQRTAKAQVRKEQFGKGFGAGAGIAGASALGGVPVLGDAVTGGLAAGFSGASVAAGALGGAIVGIGVAAVGVTADVTSFNNALTLQQKALANTVATADELEAALAAIENVSKDFVVPIGDATEQFTKLNAAARASGFGVSKVEEVYRGLAAANVALGGDAERLNGILLATQQVFSKGKVQAEELRGQIGERLAGAFAKFAKSAGLSTSELDKALEKGEVSLKDFVKFSKSLLDEYEDDAKRIADAPENAAARLKQSMDNLRRAMGPIVTDIGNMFINMANTIVKALTMAFNAINAARTEAAQKQAAADRQNLQNVRGDLQKAQENFQANPNFATKFELDRQTRAVKAANEMVRGSAQTLIELQALNLEATGGKLEKMTVETSETGNADGKKGGSGKTTKEYESQAAALLNQQKYLEGILRLESGRVATTERLATDQDLLMSKLQVQLQYEKDLDDLKREKLDDVDRELKATNLLLQLKIDLKTIDNEEAQRQFDLARSFQDKVDALEDQIKLEEAVTEQQRRQVEYAAARRAIENDGSLSGPEKQTLLGLQDRLNQVREANANPINQYLKQLNEELSNTDAMIVQLAQTVETELASAMSSAVTGLITGTKTAQEAFAEMFANIGKAFVDMATQMIAKALVMKALNILLPGAAPAAASTPTPAFDLFNTAPEGFNNIGPMTRFEGGGYTGTGPRAGGLDGRGGYMAMVHPDETIIDHRSPMGRYSGGNSPSNGGAMTISFQTQMINNVEYVTKDEAMAMSRAAANDGAKRGAQSGHARSMQTLQNSRSQRAKLGMS